MKYSKHQKKNRDFIEKVLSFLEENKPLKYKSKKIKRQIDTLKYCPARVKSLLYKKVMKIARQGKNEKNMKELNKTMNLAVRKMDTVKKKTWLRFQIEQGRKNKGYTKHGYTLDSKPFIFYLCSEHKNCADGHQEWQGKIYVDRYWKSVMVGAGCTDRDIYSVQSYIKNHKIISIQKVINGQPYLITRPYCKHYMIPVSTDEVLTSSLNKIKRSNL